MTMYRDTLTTIRYHFAHFLTGQTEHSDRIAADIGEPEPIRADAKRQADALRAALEHYQRPTPPPFDPANPRHCPHCHADLTGVTIIVVSEAYQNYDPATDYWESANVGDTLHMDCPSCYGVLSDATVDALRAYDPDTEPDGTYDYDPERDEPPQPTSDDYKEIADRFETALYGETREDCPDCWGVGELAPLVLCPQCHGAGSIERTA